MPRLNTDYSRTQMYRLVCNDVSITETYVGHTTNWTKRKCSHKSVCNNKNAKYYNLKIYQTIRANGGWDNWLMVLIEVFPCTNILEACKRERELYEQFDAKMNMVKPYRTKEEQNTYNIVNNREYYKLNADAVSETHKKYYEKNKDVILQKRRDKQKSLLLCLSL